MRVLQQVIYQNDFKVKAIWRRKWLKGMEPQKTTSLMVHREMTR